MSACVKPGLMLQKPVIILGSPPPTASAPVSAQGYQLAMSCLLLEGGGVGWGGETSLKTQTHSICLFLQNAKAKQKF